MLNSSMSKQGKIFEKKEKQRALRGLRGLRAAGRKPKSLLLE
jgi:hypothetical protein